jgi:hypothetical protein
MGVSNMGVNEIILHFELNEAQELLINNLYITCREKYNYIRSDIIDNIVHSDFYYELTDENRKEYNDLYLPILNMIIDREDKWNAI